MESYDAFVARLILDLMVPLAPVAHSPPPLNIIVPAPIAKKIATSPFDIPKLEKEISKKKNECVC